MLVANFYYTMLVNSILELSKQDWLALVVLMKSPRVIIVDFVHDALGEELGDRSSGTSS